MREQRLLERIRSWKKDPLRREAEDPRRMKDSVLSHLQSILNTRRGSVQISDEFGAPDFTDFLHMFPDTLRDIERSIKQTIATFEPRLKSVRVIFVPQEEDVLTPRFRIEARLLTQEKVPVVFESMVETDGKIKIR